jgi:hypothetical protein
MSNGPRSCIDIPDSEPAAASLQYLPDDITLLIATEFVDDNNAFRDLCILTSICSHLRTLFLNTPGLWTAIDFEAQPTPWIDLCIYRARDTPISLELYINGDFHHEIELGRRCLSKASRLSVYLIRHSKAALSAFWRAFDSSIDASRLEMLDITGSPFVEVLLDLNRPCLLKASKLCRMKLVDATVQGLAQLPALVNLEIQRAYISPGCLHSLFVSAPGLSKICLSDTKLTAQHVPGAMDQIYLPRLQTLQILHSSLEAVAAILHMISNPHRSLIIRVGNAEWNAPDNTYIVERVQQFWASRQPSSPQIFPVAVVSAGGQVAGHVKIEMIATTQEQKDYLKLYYQCQCTGTGPGSLVGSMRIKTARIDCRYDQRLPMDFLEWFDDVETLLIHDKGCSSGKWDQCTDVLEAYVRRRRNQGRVLKSFFFRFRDEGPDTTGSMRSFHDRLAAEYGSGSVTWTSIP